MRKEALYNERDLLLLIANSDKQAYQQLFDRYWGQVYGTCLRLTKSPELSKDLAQDIFLKLWERRSKLPEVKSVNAWLYTVSRNLISDFIRKNVLSPSNADELKEYFSSDELDTQERLEYLELETLVKKAVGQLSPQLRQVFMLSRYEELSHEEIALRMGISRASSKVYIVRALAQIRAYIATHASKPLIFIWLFLVMMPGKFF